MDEDENKPAINRLSEAFRNSTPEQRNVSIGKYPLQTAHQIFENQFADNIGFNYSRNAKGLSPLYPNPSIKDYRQEMKLKPMDPDPTQEELKRLSLYNRQIIKHYSNTGEVLLGSFREAEEQRRLGEFREFNAFSSLYEIFGEWDCLSGRVVETKFVKPSTLSEWHTTIYKCATMVKVLKTLDEFMPTSIHEHNFVYQSKTLYRKTTHSFEYDAANFAFVVKTGLGSAGQELRNVPVDFYKQAQQQLHTLLDTMKQELPQTHYEQVFMLYILIKDKKHVVL